VVASSFFCRWQLRSRHSLDEIALVPMWSPHPISSFAWTPTRDSVCADAPCNWQKEH
jgi:hypothetical protein